MSNEIVFSATVASNATTATTTPCYTSDIMYRDDIILSIIEIETNDSISIPSLRADKSGVTFTNTQQPTLLVKLNYKLISHIISISVPNVNNVSNVNQVELAFYGTDGHILRNSLNQSWVVETIPGVTAVCLFFDLAKDSK
jgi:hypothetical protein